MGVLAFGITFGLAAAISVGFLSGSLLTAFMAYVTLGTMSVFAAAVAVYLRAEEQPVESDLKAPLLTD